MVKSVINALPLFYLSLYKASISNKLGKYKQASCGFGDMRVRKLLGLGGIKFVDRREKVGWESGI